MGARLSSDGRERTVLARIIDPNGLLIEQTEGWESGTLTQAAEQLKNMRPNEIQATKNTRHASQMSIDMDVGAYDEPAGDFITEKKANEPPALRAEPIVDTQMSMIAPPALVRWMSSNSSTSSGEEIFQRRRSGSIGNEEGQNLVSVLHRRVNSMSGYTDHLDTNSLQQPNV